ncbi:unnamed protein product [Spirodela intermedia]|uniref:Uncharacterized protein n=1 Tax=Spirodela intermedia TaxID=51605 RepID=A0A7I8J7T4_SPIIN|nr:unnamed protein product [Spirodela intermedia]CAA6666296.1 unnamed protein product [Spirodela intermedia]
MTGLMIIVQDIPLLLTSQMMLSPLALKPALEIRHVEDIIVEPLVANEADCANQELHLETLISDTTGTLSGMVGDRFPCDTTIDNGTNRHALETASTIHPSLPTPTSITLAHAKGLHCQSDGIADPCTEGVSVLDSANVIVPTVIDFSSEDENDGVDPEEFITSEADCQDEDLPLGPINSNTITTSARVLADKVPIDTTLGNSGNAESLEIGDSTKDKADDVQEGHASNGKEHSSIDGVSNVPVGGCSGNSSVLHEHNTEENQTSVSSSLEVEAPQRRQSKQRKAARRQSLADAGTAWQCGVRRSTRIRTKPLAHWRGERLLYARIHDTLPTVIGLKYASPAKGGQEAPVLRVKSYVSEEYADLVQKVALH